MASNKSWLLETLPAAANDWPCCGPAIAPDRFQEVSEVMPNQRTPPITSNGESGVLARLYPPASVSMLPLRLVLVPLFNDAEAGVAEAPAVKSTDRTALFSVENLR